VSDWALSGSANYTSGGDIPASTTVALVTASATVNTKGAWTDLVTTTPSTFTAILLSVSTGASNQHALMDIGVGASGSEEIIVPDLLFAQPIRVVAPTIIPVHVPAGSRIAIRVSSRTASGTLSVMMHGIAGNSVLPPPVSTVDAYGISASPVGGTLIDAGATANTKGAWTQISAATSRHIRSLMIAVTRADNTTTPGGSLANFMDVGVGASGSEQALITNVRYVTSVATPSLFPAMLPPIPCSIPAGSRLAVRLQSSFATTPDRTCHCALYGLA
jgi:hypothetical protein